MPKTKLTAAQKTANKALLVSVTKELNNRDLTGIPTVQLLKFHEYLVSLNEEDSDSDSQLDVVGDTSNMSLIDFRKHLADKEKKKLKT